MSQIRRLSVLAALSLAAGLGLTGCQSQPLRAHGDEEVKLRFTLTPEQDSEVQRQRIFRPTPKQFAQLRAIESTCPEEFRVITPRWNECRCGLTGAVVWSKPGVVTAEGGRLSRWTKIDVDLLRREAAAGDTLAIATLDNRGSEYENEMAALARRRAQHPSNDFSLVMDYQGRVFYAGRLLLPAAMDSFLSTRGDSGEAVIYLPLEDPDPQARVGEIEQLMDLGWRCARRGFRLYVHG